MVSKTIIGHRKLDVIAIAARLAIRTRGIVHWSEGSGPGDVVIAGPCREIHIHGYCGVVEVRYR